MKKLTFGILSIALIAGVVAFIPYGGDEDKIETIKIGDRAPNLSQSLPGTTGESKILREFGSDNGMLVIFTCNTCPFVMAWQDRYNELYELCEKNNIGMVLVNPNEAKRGKGDSMEDMKAHAKKEGYKAPYVLDEKSQLANAFGAKTTPHVFLFNNQFNLVYKGAIDDNYKSQEKVEQTYLKDAVKSLIQNEPITPNDTKALGCSIKRV